MPVTLCTAAASDREELTVDARSATELVADDLASYNDNGLVRGRG